MAVSSYLPAVICRLLFCSAIILPFAVNKSGVYGGRQQPDNQILEMNSPIKGSTAERNLGEFGLGIRLPLESGTNGNFLVTIGFGTPESDFTLLFDTGSDVTWIKCDPCSPNCNPTQTSSIFIPSSSSTFSMINDTCNNPNCEYSGHYNDGTSFSGYFVKDTLTIVSDRHPNFIFACAQQINGEFEGASGLLGVGKGNYSLIAQTDGTLFSIFCYCLPASKSSSGYIVFGAQAFETCQPETNKMIPIEPAPGQLGLTGYYISLTGITIGGKRLEISSIGSSSSSSIKAIIDSGTVISRLPKSLYLALRTEFQAIMSGFRMSASPEPDLLDTCYDLGGEINNWTPPNIELHFGDRLDVDLDSSAATLPGKSSSQVCLAFSGNKDDNDLVIIGNQQHRYRDLFFDIKNQMFYFSSFGCSNI